MNDIYDHISKQEKAQNKGLQICIVDGKSLLSQELKTGRL